MSVSTDDVLVGGQLRKTHRASRVELLGGDAHLASKSEFAAVGETGGGIDVDRRAVHKGGEAVGNLVVFRDDGVAMVRGMASDVLDGVVRAVYHAYGENIVKKFGVEIRLARRRAAHNGVCAGVGAEFNRRLARGDSCLREAGAEQGKEALRNIAVYKADLLGVTHRGTAGLGVFNDGKRLVEVSVAVYVHVADARARLDAGHRGVFHAGADETRTAAGDEKIHVAVGLHKGGGAFAGRVLNAKHRVLGKTHRGKRTANGSDDGGVAFGRLLAAAQNGNVAALERQRRRVGGHVGSAFIYDGNHADGDGFLDDCKSVLAHRCGKGVSERRGEGGNLADAVRHTADAVGGEAQSVKHHGGDARGRRKILGVCRKDGVGGFGGLQLVGDGNEGLVELCRVKFCKKRNGVFRRRKNIVCGSHNLSLLGLGIESGAHGLALGDGVEAVGVGAVGNDHIASALRRDLRRAELGGHTARAESRALAAAQGADIVVDAVHTLNEGGGGILVGIGGKETVDIGKEHQHIGAHADGYEGREGVVVANADLLGSNRIVFVDDGKHLHLKKSLHSVLKVAVTLLVAKIVCGEQDLRHGMVVFREQLVVGVHQLALTHGGGRLLARHVTGTLGKIQLANAHADSARGNENDLVSGVTQVADDLAKQLDSFYVQSARCVGEGRGSDLDYHFHRCLPSRMPET